MSAKEKQHERKRISLFDHADVLETTRNLLKSYHSDTDVLSELVQNSINNLLLNNVPNPSIAIRYDASKNQLEVQDNGTGLTEDEMKYFALGTSGTKNREGTLGLFGFGAAYILAVSDYFEVESWTRGTHVSALCEGAFDAIVNRGDEPDFFIIDSSGNSTEKQGTRVTVRVDPSRLRSFKDWNDLEREVRTKTAAGYTKKLFGDKWEVGLNLQFGASDAKTAKFGYRSLAEDMPDKVVDFEKVDNAASYKGHVLRLTDENIADGVRVLLLLASTETFKHHHVLPGIWLSYRGNPLQIEIKPPSTKGASTWRNVHMLIQFDSLDLDPGRKSIMHGSKTRVGLLASRCFNKVVDIAPLFISGQEEQARKSALSQLKDWARDLEDIIPPQGIRFSKLPIKEQGVIALFHELVGAGYLSNYHTLFSAQDSPYDAVISYECSECELGEAYRKIWKKQIGTTKPKGTGWTNEMYKELLIVEFKQSVHEFINDRKKSIEDVKLLIVWSGVDDSLPTGWRVNLVPEEERPYQYVKYKLTDKVDRSVWVMSLKHILEDINSSSSTKDG